MIDIVTVKQMQEFDQMTIKTKTPSIELMNLAAKSIYEECDFSNKKISIICGSGNNGGDGLALAHILIEKGFSPYVYLISKKISNDSQFYLDKLNEKKYENIFDISKCNYDFDIIVDCILGTGFKGEVKENIKDVIININNSRAYVISADIPSGLNGDNGLKTECVKADQTIAIQYYKTGHFLNDGKDCVGKIVAKDIGIEKTEETYKIIEDKDIVFPKRKNNSSKYSYGRSLIIGGCENFVGAVKIANMGVSSLRIGAGLNTIAAPRSIIPTLQSSVVESTLYPLDEIDGHIKFNKEQLDKIMLSVNAIALGMGMGNNYVENKKIISHILENYSSNVLLDADAINAFKDDIDSLCKNKKASIIITPHIKEMARISGIDEKEIISSPIESAKAVANKIGGIVLLKGASSIITNGRDVYFVVNGGPELSKGGSGDTLSGVILGLLAQGFEPIKAAYMGAFLCAKAAKDLTKDFSEYGVLASDVARNISKYIKE